MNIFNLHRHAVTALRLSALALFLAPALAHATITITSAPSVVTYDVENYAIAGTNTVGITGDMWVSNASLGGAAITFSRSGLAFETPAVNLALGYNYITVYGSDGGSTVYSDTINIWRYSIDGGANTAGSAYGRRLHGSLVGWGWNYYGQTNCPAGNDFAAIAAGENHSIALRHNGSIVGWGDNYYGQTNCPAENDFAAIAAGENHSIALRRNGSIVGWGDNYYGQTNCPAGNDFVAIAAGDLHSLALRRDGSIVGWGGNGSGQTTCPAGNDFAAIAAGKSHSLALRRDGSIVGWGANYYGQTTCPVGNDFVAITAGDLHSLALRRDGSIVGWGRNDSGQTTCPAGNDFAAIAAGESHSLALRCDGSLAGWGTNQYGQTTCPAGNDFATVAAGGYHSLALRFHPFVDITNAYHAVPYDVTHCTIGGTNSPFVNSVVGTMWWTNAANGSAGSFPASQSWQIENISVILGTNDITVFGTNVYGLLGYDSVRITRTFPAGTEMALIQPMNGFLTNDFTVQFDVAYGDAIAYRLLATNSVPVFDELSGFPYTNSITFVSTGLVYWTAVGYKSNYNLSWASCTNCLTIQKTLHPGIHLVAPLSGTCLTNVFSCKLYVDFGVAALDHQVSTNAGLSWFAYDVDNQMVFNSLGTYSWTARGRTAAGWWYAPETNTLMVTTNFSGARAIFLLEPADGLVTTNPAPAFRVHTYGEAFTFTQISIDGAAYTTVVCPTNIYLPTGRHAWTARGGVGMPPSYTYAPTTNVFWIMPEEYQPSHVCITSMVETVNYDVTNVVLAGTNTSGIVGGMWIENASAGGSSMHFSRSGLAFTAPSIALNTGTNLLWVTGTNAFGQSASDCVIITREAEPLPFVDITSADATVTYGVTSYTIGGTNNANVVGTLDWANSLGGSGSLNAASSWQITDIPLAEGTNEITVTGTNMYGLISNDLIAIYRKAWTESIPQIATNALVFPACESVLLAGPLTSIVWHSEAIWDYVDNTTVIIAQISAHPSNDVKSVIVVTNNVSNVCGRVDWNVPAALANDQEVYVIRFDVINSSMLTNSMVFTDNPFTVIPEPYTGVLLLLAVLRGAYARKKHVWN